MREVAVDTETTGLDPDKGDRIVEIGLVEMVDFVPTGNTFQVYINPERDMPTEAFDVHGLSEEFLSDKPVFSEIVDSFLDYIGDSRLVIHNAAFDMKFLNSELRSAGKPEISTDRVVDTLLIARDRFPGGVATLDALCSRMGVDRSNRKVHGALLDATLLASAYMELNGGRAPRFELSNAETQDVRERSGRALAMPRPSPLPPRISDAEVSAHEAFMALIEKKSGKPVWDAAFREPETASPSP